MNVDFVATGAFANFDVAIAARAIAWMVTFTVDAFYKIFQSSSVLPASKCIFKASEDGGHTSVL